MIEGTIRKLADRGFGFIRSDLGHDVFFHMSAVVATSFEQLREGQRVSYTENNGERGRRAENVVPV